MAITVFANIKKSQLPMIINHQKLTFNEYLNYQDNTDNRYELLEGELIPISLGTGKHGAIAKRLERFFDDEITRLELPWIAQRFSVGLRSLLKPPIKSSPF